MTTRRERTLNYNKLVEKEYQEELQRLHDKKSEGRMCNYNYYEHIYTLTNLLKLVLYTDRSIPTSVYYDTTKLNILHKQ